MYILKIFLFDRKKWGYFTLSPNKVAKECVSFENTQQRQIHNSTRTGNAYVGVCMQAFPEQSVILTNMDSRPGSTHTVGATPATASRHNAVWEEAGRGVESSERERRERATISCYDESWWEWRYTSPSHLYLPLSLSLPHTYSIDLLPGTLTDTPAHNLHAAAPQWLHLCP